MVKGLGKVPAVDWHQFRLDVEALFKELHIPKKNLNIIQSKIVANLLKPASAKVMLKTATNSDSGCNVCERLQIVSEAEFACRDDCRSVPRCDNHRFGVLIGTPGE